MATSLNGATKVNPRYYKGPKPATQSILIGNSATYKAGQLGYRDTSGLGVACADDAANAEFIFANTRDSAATATMDEVHFIDSDTEFVWFVVNGTSDTEATQAMVGDLMSIEVIDNVCVLDKDTAGGHSNDIVKVTGLMKDKEPKRHALADSPGQVIGHIIRTASQDIAAA